MQKNGGEKPGIDQTISYVNVHNTRVSEAEGE